MLSWAVHIYVAGYINCQLKMSFPCACDNMNGWLIYVVLGVYYNTQEDTLTLLSCYHTHKKTCF